MAKKIIIIDDDQFIRELYQEVLTKAGYDIETAENGEQGLAKLTTGGYDLVLLDVMMPKVDGLGVLKTLKDTPPAKPNGPIIILTNLDHDPILDQAKILGAHSLVLKADILPPQLIELINGILQPVQ